MSARYASHASEERFRGQEPDRDPYRFTVDNMRAMQKIGILGDKGGIELLDGIMLMRSSDVPMRLHSSDLAELYEAGIIPVDIPTQMIEGVVYHARPRR